MKQDPEIALAAHRPTDMRRAEASAPSSRAAEVKMKRILVPIDGSDHSMVAAQRAARIAASTGASLVILAVIPDVPSLEEDLRAYARAEKIVGGLSEVLSAARPVFLDEALEQARAAGVREVAAEAVEGEPASEILAKAREEGVDLIVLGSRGRGQLAGLLLGSISQKVAALAPCSVLIAR